MAENLSCSIGDVGSLSAVSVGGASDLECALPTQHMSVGCVAADAGPSGKQCSEGGPTVQASSAVMEAPQANSAAGGAGARSCVDRHTGGVE